MGIHKQSKAQVLRDYIKDNPSATRQQMVDALGFSHEFIRSALNNDKRRFLKHGLLRKPGRPPTYFAKTSVGVKLNGGYYSLDKLKDIVKALEVLSKISGVAKTNND